MLFIDNHDNLDSEVLENLKEFFEELLNNDWQLNPLCESIYKEVIEILENK